MIEPPSEELLQRLLDNGLCKRSDLRRCRKQVRKLARDLPAFDSVWIDSLQQIRKLTPFQAKILQSPQPERIAIGPYVLLNQLGQSNRSATFLARSQQHLIGSATGSENGRPKNNRCVLKVIPFSEESAIRFHEEQLQQLVSKFARCSHSSVVVPTAVLRHENQLLISSRFVDGADCSELMIRRGRFPAAEVTAIVAQLINALAELETNHTTHGAIRLANVRLTSAGHAVLVDAGILPAISPELIVTPHISPERYDGIAPELIGTGQPKTSQSDMYALGCLLWQLLAGRPPYSTGDPLAKLALHQTRELLDIREWAPDTPAELAALIRHLTCPVPQERPSSFAELRQFRPADQAGQRCLSQFYTALHSRVKTLPTNNRFQTEVTPKTGSRWMFFAAGLFAISGIIAALFDNGLQTQLLQMTSPVTDYLSLSAEQFATDSSNAPPNSNANKQKKSSVQNNDPFADITGIPLPAPNANGEIFLATKGPYLWDSRIDAVGEIRIKGTGEQPPIVFIAPGTALLSADRVLFENIHFRLLTSQQKTPYLRIHAQNLSLLQCRLSGENTQNHDAQSQSVNTAISWTLNDTTDRSGGRLQIHNTAHFGPLDTIRIETAPNVIDCQNVLKVGNGKLFQFAASPKSGRTCQINLNQTTLRTAAALAGLQIQGGENGTGSKATGLFAIKATNCVFDFAPKDSALFHLSGELNSNESPLIQLSGSGSVARPNLVIAGEFGPATPQKPRGQFDSLGSAEQWITLEGGILTAPFQFTGPANEQPKNSQITVKGIPRQSSGPPGITAEKLP